MSNHNEISFSACKLKRLHFASCLCIACIAFFGGECDCSPMKNTMLQYWNVLEAIALGYQVIFLSVRDYHAA